ncbi:MAG: hypothetical protein MMC33_007775 [Icmadophila ericetorum]|nr:hypothetical protein [Icmadophila ericetorum]
MSNTFRWSAVSFLPSSQESTPRCVRFSENTEIIVAPQRGSIEPPTSRPTSRHLKAVFDHRWKQSEVHDACVMSIWGRISSRDIARNLCKMYKIEVIPDQVDDMLHFMREGSSAKIKRPVNFEEQGYQDTLWHEIQRLDRWSLRIQKLMRTYRIRQYGWHHQLQDDAIVLMQLFTSLNDNDQAEHLARFFHNELHEPCFPLQAYSGWGVWNRYYEIVRQWNGSARFWANVGPNNDYTKQMMVHFQIWKHRLEIPDGSNVSNEFQFPTPHGVSDSNNSALRNAERRKMDPEALLLLPEPEPDYVAMYINPECIEEEVPSEQRNGDMEVQETEKAVENQETAPEASDQDVEMEEAL